MLPSVSSHKYYAIHTVIVVVVIVWLPQSHLTLCSPMNCNPVRLLCPWDYPGKNTGACHSVMADSFQPHGL